MGKRGTGLVLGAKLSLIFTILTTAAWGYAGRSGSCLGRLSNLNPHLIKIKEAYTLRFDTEELSDEEQGLMQRLEEVTEQGVRLSAPGTAEEITSRIHWQIAMNQKRQELLSNREPVFTRLGIDNEAKFLDLQRVILEFAVDLENPDWQKNAEVAGRVLLRHPDEVIGILQSLFTVVGTPLPVETAEKQILQKIALKLGYLGAGPALVANLDHRSLQGSYPHFVDLLAAHLRASDPAWQVVDQESLEQFTYQLNLTH